jgi:pilus assembly protein CpaB
VWLHQFNTTGGPILGANNKENRRVNQGTRRAHQYNRDDRLCSLFGLIAVFLAQTWLNNQADARMRSLEAQRKSAPASHTMVVASKALRFGDELAAHSLREVPWPDDALPAGAFSRVAELTSGKRVVLMPIDANEAILAAKITGPGQRATLSAMLRDGMKAVTIRVNDVEGVAGFVLPPSPRG